MDFIPAKLLYVHLIDENYLFEADIKERYSPGNKYILHVYPSADKFFNEFNSRKNSKKNDHVVILAVHMGKPDKYLKSGIIERIINLIPNAEVINVCHHKELEKDVSSLRKGNMIHIANNENVMFRIDNAFKWIIARKNFENKRRICRFTAFSFLVFFLFTLSGFVYVLLTG
ncbi:MAG: hypothetical protein EA408_07615 [Marinilabiliales bacterium]|nr:MAG: hypothetical protein EA408_07615 [Marinilabiliales bacterium]